MLVLETKKAKNTTMILQIKTRLQKNINAMDNDSSKSKESFVEDFWVFKKSFFTDVNVFNHQLLTPYVTDNVNKSNVNNSNNSI